MTKSLSTAQTPETIAHMMHCEAVTSEAVTLALLRKEPLLPGLHPERDLGKLFNLGRYDFDDLQRYFNFRRRILLDVLTGLTENQWSRTVQETGKQRRESVYWLARGQALHEDGHLGEIEGLISGQISGDTRRIIGKSTRV
ncbi:MAG: DinB family protein [Anaerolineales bacterium]|nr:DinB family protein [Anaerolineales bacterium]